MTDAYIIDAARTPRGIGKLGKGSLSEFHPSRLLAKVFEGIEQRNDLNTAEIDDVVVGCSSQVGKQGSCIGRMAALDAGWDTSASAVTLDRFYSIPIVLERCSKGHPGLAGVAVH